jgi:iron(III) transport system substrate-binding protein
MDTLSRRTFLAGTALTLAGGVRPSFAQASNQVVDMAAAKKEGKVVWYCSVPIATAQKIANLFQTKTGINVELFRSGGSNILRRFQQEGDSGKVFVDVLTHSDPAAANALTKKDKFVPFKATDFD